MPDEFEVARARLKADSADYDAAIREFVKGSLSDEQLKEDWDRLRGAARRSSLQNSSKRNVPTSFWTGMQELLRPPSIRFAFASGLVVCAIVGILFWRTTQPQTIQLVALADPERSGEISLPKNFQLDMQKQNLELSNGRDRLSGSFTPSSPESSPGVPAFAIRLEGKDSAGATGIFTGTLWLTNAAGQTTIQKQKDLTGARLRGSFEIVGKSTNSVEQSFAP